MEGRGGCCIARYDMSKWDKIMLRFRPIAPKPVAGKVPAVSDASSSEGSDAFSTTINAKRKYVRSVKDRNKNKNNTNKRLRTRQRTTTTALPEPKQNPAPVVTLPLLPETPDLKDLTKTASKEVHNTSSNNMPVGLSFEEKLNHTGVESEPEPFWFYGDSTVTRTYSCVTVESVADTWQEVESLGSTDEERRIKLSKDTCPGFVSDGYGRVTWTNGAYREMVGEGACVLLAMKENVVSSAVITNPTSFTCRVRVVQYDTWGKERSSLTVPCDVWRMDFGGFAWRLDVKAALSLSLG